MENDETPAPVRITRNGTGLQRLRAIAPTQALVDSLAQEPTETMGPAIPQQENPHANQVVSEREQMQMMREWAAGASLPDVEARYGVSRGYIRAAMLRKFGSKEAMLATLQNLVLENAVGAQMIAQSKLHELSGAQAVFAGKLLVETMGNLDSQIKNKPKTINFNELAQLGKTLSELKAIVTPKKASDQA